jgi:transcription elongation factor Elf1
MSEYGPICPKCKKEMRCQKGRVPITNECVLWYGARYRCPVCGAEAVVIATDRIELHTEQGRALMERESKNPELVTCTDL